MVKGVAEQKRPLTIAIASGKGGTGKTTVAINLALSVPKVQYLDCDVEAPNGHLFLRPTIHTRHAVQVTLPRIDDALCTRCGLCAEACEFNALAVTPRQVLVFPDLCHSCGVCSYVCPVADAITETQRSIGTVAVGVAATAHGEQLPLAQGLLNIGESTAVPVIKMVRQQAQAGYTALLDAPPGTACPMVETVREADYCLLVTEPTPFGLNDLALAVGVTQALGVACGVVLNRSDVGDDGVAQYCRAQGIPILLEIPFQRELAEAYSNGIPWVIAQPAAREHFQALFQAISAEVAAGKP